jgi:hypothetical protein
VEWNKLGSLKNTVPNLRGSLNCRANRIDHADKYQMLWLKKFADHTQNTLLVGLAGHLEIEPADVQIKQVRQQGRVVDICAVGGIVVAARAGMYPDSSALLTRESLQHFVVQGDEASQKSARWIKLQGEPAFGEIDLDTGSAGIESATDIRFRLVDKINKKLLSCVAGYPCRRKKQTHGGS